MDDLDDFRDAFIDYMNNQQKLFDFNKDEKNDIVI